MKELRVGHLLNRRFTAWAVIVLAVRKLVFAVHTDELVFFLGGYHPVAFTATDKAGKGKFMLRLWAWCSVAAK
ncbi:MAG: hypothetical protein WCS89_03850 [Candidatus Paceibacterota bacterium]